VLYTERQKALATEYEPADAVHPRSPPRIKVRPSPMDREVAPGTGA
jgi:hypothetical protein